jgi:hypothetical protein
MHTLTTTEAPPQGAAEFHNYEDNYMTDYEYDLSIPRRKESLLTDALRSTLPPLFRTEGVANPTVHARFFHPASEWVWYVIEFDGKDMLFGIVYGFVREWGYFSLSELEGVRDPLGLQIERDDHFVACRVNELPKFYSR